MNPQEMQIDELYVNDPYTFYIELQNTPNVQAKFCWQNASIDENIC